MVQPRRVERPGAADPDVPGGRTAGGELPGDAARGELRAVDRLHQPGGHDGVRADGATGTPLPDLERRWPAGSRPRSTNWRRSRPRVAAARRSTRSRLSGPACQSATSLSQRPGASSCGTCPRSGKIRPRHVGMGAPARPRRSATGTNRSRRPWSTRTGQSDASSARVGDVGAPPESEHRAGRVEERRRSRRDRPARSRSEVDVQRARPRAGSTRDRRRPYGSPSRTMRSGSMCRTRASTNRSPTAGRSVHRERRHHGGMRRCRPGPTGRPTPSAPAPSTERRLHRGLQDARSRLPSSSRRPRRARSPSSPMKRDSDPALVHEAGAPARSRRPPESREIERERPGRGPAEPGGDLQPVEVRAAQAVDHHERRRPRARPSPIRDGAVEVQVESSGGAVSIDQGYRRRRRRLPTRTDFVGRVRSEIARSHGKRSWPCSVAPGRKCWNIETDREGRLRGRTRDRRRPDAFVNVFTRPSHALTFTNASTTPYHTVERLPRRFFRAPCSRSAAST